MDDKWIDSIKDRMADYEIAPPDGLLEAVEGKIRVRRMRRRFAFGVIAASIALLIGFSVALNPDISDIAYHGPLVSDATGEKTGKEISEEVIKQVAENTVIPESIPINPKSRRVVVATNMDIPTLASTNPVVSDYHPSISPGYEEETHSEEQSHPSIKPDDTRYAEYEFSAQPIDSRTDVHVPVYMEVSTSANGLGGILGEDGIENRLLMASACLPHSRMGGGMLGSTNSFEPPAPRFIEMFDHRLPVRASIEFSLPIGYSLSVGTGVTYSYLRSDIRYGYSDSPLFKALQSLHFLGIPVNLRYSPFNVGKLDIYVSTGFMAEKCIGGGIKTENSSNPEYSYTGSDDRPFQLSFNAAVGLQYGLANKCAVFIEPGLGLYLKNGSKLRTIYSERPVTFNVNVGLRFGR